MVHTNPILRFAIDLFMYSLELQARRGDRERKLAVLHLAQVVELAVKAALVERNVSIYLKDSRSISTHDAQESLAKELKHPLTMRARAELLIDERNAIQHRYGQLDDVTLDFHLETVCVILREILKECFDTSLDELVRTALPREVWSKVRFIESDEPAPLPSSEEADEEPYLALLGGFYSFERRLRERLSELGLGPDYRSAMDISMKVIGNVRPVDGELLKAIPAAFALRNATAHGVAAPASDQVKLALGTLDSVRKLLDNDDHRQVVKAAVEAHRTRRAGIAAAALSSADEHDGPAADEPRGPTAD